MQLFEELHFCRAKIEFVHFRKHHCRAVRNQSFCAKTAFCSGLKFRQSLLQVLVFGSGHKTEQLPWQPKHFPQELLHSTFLHCINFFLGFTPLCAIVFPSEKRISLIQCIVNSKKWLPNETETATCTADRCPCKEMMHQHWNLSSNSAATESVEILILMDSSSLWFWPHFIAKTTFSSARMNTLLNIIFTPKIDLPATFGKCLFRMSRHSTWTGVTQLHRHPSRPREHTHTHTHARKHTRTQGWQWEPLALLVAAEATHVPHPEPRIKK